MPKEFGADRSHLVGVVLNGITTRVPFHRSPDFNLTPLQGVRGSVERHVR